MNEIQCFSIRYLFKFWQILIIITDLLWAALHDRGIFWYKSRPLHSNTQKYLHRCQGQLVQHKKQVMIWKGTQTMVKSPKDCGIYFFYAQATIKHCTRTFLWHSIQHNVLQAHFNAHTKYCAISKMMVFRQWFAWSPWAQTGKSGQQDCL